VNPPLPHTAIVAINAQVNYKADSAIYQLEFSSSIFLAKFSNRLI